MQIISITINIDKREGMIHMEGSIYIHRVVFSLNQYQDSLTTEIQFMVIQEVRSIRQVSTTTLAKETLVVNIRAMQNQ